ncbi:MAG TPA: arylsulfatase [Novosphingobium sp.]|nr:arylsulfatase [Novosphingobium sp.]
MRRKRHLHLSCIALLALAAGATLPASLRAAPAPAPQWRHYPTPPQAPKGAPNVLLIMTDDVGFSASTSFGGAIPTPTFDMLATTGLRYNAFHTTAMCSPSRAALLTGRNHHAVATGALTNLATDNEGYTSVIPDSAATIARVMQLNGYDTAWVGKNHNTPVWETGPTGPFNHWPNAMGFDYFYGFNNAMTDQFAPDMVENRNPVDIAKDDPSYIVDRDLADHLIHWMQVHRSVRPDRPFFAYWSPGTVHSPHQAPADWIARFKGRFDGGWDKLREDTFARQKQLGIIPANARLTPRPEGMPAWASLTPEQQHIAARMMEVAAAQLAHSDYQIGRVVDWLKQTGQFDNTLIIFIQGDNGASPESLHGANNELTSLMGLEPDAADLARGIEWHGGRFAFGNYPAAWAWATNTPFQWGKEIASHLGGLRDAMAISWPARIHQGGLRTQFGHLIDVAPTIYEAAGITAPATVDGVRQQPVDGTSLVYTFDHPEAANRHTDQYFELLGNRSFFSNGWMASTTPEVAPWDRTHGLADASKMRWELYDLNSDYSQAINVAAQYPAKLAELRHKFDEAARRYHVEPISGDIMAKLAPTLRPNLLAGRNHFTYWPGDTRYPENSLPLIRPGWSMTAHVTVADGNAAGPLVSSGDHSSSYGLLLDNGFPAFLYNPTGREAERVRVQGTTPLTPGAHTISVAFEADREKGPRASRVVLRIDGQVADSALSPITYRTFGYTFIGRDSLGPLTPDAGTGPLRGAALSTVDVDLKP